MRPILFTIPLIDFRVPSYGLMLGLGFIFALLLARWRSRQAGEDSDNVTNICIYCLLAGVIGARGFHVIHYWSDYRNNLMGIIATWSGGLEFLGGVILAILVMGVYFYRSKLPARKFLDILGPSLMLGLAFGRVGCLLNGCCFGGACELPWAIEFPAVHEHATPGCNKGHFPQYSHAYYYQLFPDADRGTGPLLILPDNYYWGFTDGEGHYVQSARDIPVGEEVNYYPELKYPHELTEQQYQDLHDGKYPMYPVHPTQIYSILSALSICLLLNLFYKRLKYDGQVFGLMLILYGIARFGIESLRTDSPLEFDGLTISQNLSLIIIPIGIVMLVFSKRFAQIQYFKKLPK